MMRPLSSRWLIPFALVVLLLPACSDSDDGATDSTVATTTTEAVTSTAAPTTTTTVAASAADLAISFQGAWHSDTNVFEWQATGPAVDEGLICAEATKVDGSWELEDGTPLTEPELAALNNGTEPFTYLEIGTMSCVDGSGGFTMLSTTVATNPAAFESTTTWELQGDEGYDGVTGEGTLDEMTMEGQPVVVVGHSSGVLHNG